MFSLFHPAHAEPVPPRKTEALGELQTRLESEKDKQAALKKEMATAESELEGSRKKMIALGKDLQQSEQALSALEEKVAALQAEQATLTQKLQSDYGSMGNLVLALQRIRRMPTETLIIRPGAPLETAQSALLLQSILPAIGKRAENLSADLARLEAIGTALEQDRAKTASTAEALKAQKDEMQALLQKRQKLYRSTRTAYDEQAEAVARMAAEAENLQQLVSRIEQSEKPVREPLQEEKVRRSSRGGKPPPLPGGAWQPPVGGSIATAFGARDDIGAESEGIRIAARPGALVTAPAGGIVRFAGTFRNYGNMVIIEHDRGFHSLISGLSRIETAVGRKISAGEPIGSLPGTGAGSPPRLYYELRHNGKPVDPAAKFPGLS
ncbi:MAG: peptidoglycan DD-metalloendopeptidase family protein [Micavibrio aeruginosavorus]|nr:peptidoglycan DD-metalloendopeptidase family protein [Micavibrio aeruginosavorus]